MTPFWKMCRTATTSVSAQHLYLHYDNGEVLYLGKDNVDSITFSNYDADSVYHDNIVTQVIHTNHTKYQIPISSIDSISCVNQDKSYTTCPDDNHPHMIDLGLPSGTKWSCCNVGASTPEGYGGYYAWGETSEKSAYLWENYEYWTDKDSDGDCDEGENQDLGSDIAGTSYDVAHVKWGGGWRMPSMEQIGELLINCNSEWTTLNGVYGWLCKGPSGGSVFLPAAGDRWSIFLDHESERCDYWSSTRHPYSDSCAISLNKGSDGESEFGTFDRVFGQSVRPVAR